MSFFGELHLGFYRLLASCNISVLSRKKKVVKVSGVQSHEAHGHCRHISHDGQGLHHLHCVPVSQEHRLLKLMQCDKAATGCASQPEGFV